MGIPYMTNKTKQKMRKGKRPQAQKKTPFADVGSIIGNAVGTLTGFGGAKNIGRWLGTGIGSIFGSGDYQMVGQQPGYNIFTSDKQIPKFETGERTNIVCHREYVGDMLSSVAFKNNTYRVNPGNQSLFPWLNQVASQYQQYRIHGMIFEFRPLITDFASGGQPGVVIMATNYNAAEAPYTSKQEMENSEYAVSVKPTLSMIHALECSPQETSITKLYIDRSNALDPRFSDMGTFQFATQSHQTDGVALGELWVSYCVEFFKPKLDFNPAELQTGELVRAAFGTSSPLGALSSGVPRGDVDQLFANNVALFWQAPVGSKWSVQITWSGDVAGTLTQADPPTISYANLEPVLFGNSLSYLYSSEIGTSSRRLILTLFIVVTDHTLNQLVTINFDGKLAGLPTVNNSVDMLISRLDKDI